MTVGRQALVSVFALCVGCLGLRDNLVSVTDVDGSNDHRIFRIGSVTRLMLEPVLWKIEDLHLVDFDRPVTESFRGFLPPEYESVTLRMLHENASGLPDRLTDPCRLSDLGDLVLRATWGTDPVSACSDREAFVARLWDLHWRRDVERREARLSDLGQTLLLMAICDRLGRTPEELCEAYLIGPYGLKDTSFAPSPGMLNRLTKPCAGGTPWLLPAGAEISDGREAAGEVARTAVGMLSSASDILRVAYVILPHLARAKPVLRSAGLACGHEVWYLAGSVPGGRAFVGFDPKAGRSAVILGNAAGDVTAEGLELLDNMVNPPREEK